jgi:hypothetical protein
MIGGIWIFELRNPFTAPKAAPTSKTTITARNQCIEDCSPTAIAAERASSDPTEMSNPPPIMTKVEPIAIMPIIELCLNMFMIFLQDRKLGVISEMTSANTKNAMMILYFPRKLTNLDLTAGPDIQLTT